MTITDLLVLVGAVVVSAGLAWFFFGTKRPTQHALRSGQSQQVTVIVRGGYTPSRIDAVAGVPLRIAFDRRESGDCSSRVVFPDLGITRALPANTTTDIDLLPEQVGEYGFPRAMNMIHGRPTYPAKTSTRLSGSPVMGAPEPIGFRVALWPKSTSGSPCSLTRTCCCSMSRTPVLTGTLTRHSGK
jgi:Cu+-exporting ATPase